MMRPVIFSILLLLSVAAALGAESVTYGAKIFVAPMEGGLHNFIAAELIKRRLPVTVVTDQSAADYILTGAALDGDNRWFHSVFGGQDKHEGSVQLVRVESQTVIWAAEAGSRNLWWGNLARGGLRKVAARLVKKMKKNLFSRR